MAIANERGKEIKESWWLLLRVAYYEQGNIPKVVEILEVLVVNWPKKEYWTMLSGMYGELNKDKRQLAAYEAAYDQGLLTRSAEIVTLAQLLMQAEAGYKASATCCSLLLPGAGFREADQLTSLSTVASRSSWYP